MKLRDAILKGAEALEGRCIGVYITKIDGRKVGCSLGAALIGAGYLSSAADLPLTDAQVYASEDRMFANVENVWPTWERITHINDHLPLETSWEEVIEALGPLADLEIVPA